MTVDASEQRRDKWRTSSGEGRITIELFLLEKYSYFVEIAENGGDLSIVLDGVSERDDSLFFDLLGEDCPSQSNEKGPNDQRVHLFFVQLNPQQE